VKYIRTRATVQNLKIQGNINGMSDSANKIITYIFILFYFFTAQGNTLSMKNTVKEKYGPQRD
jgi:hypothetical protein